jgi:hypothetical protein
MYGAKVGGRNQVVVDTLGEGEVPTNGSPAEATAIVLDSADRRASESGLLTHPGESR